MDRRLLLLWALLLPPIAAPAAADEQLNLAMFKEAGELLNEARAQRADLLSPGHFAEGQRQLAEAQRLYQEQRALKDIQSRIDRATGELNQAISLVPEAKLVLGNALAARDLAQAAEAQVHASAPYAAGENAFKDAASKLEAGKSKDAKVKAADAEREFRAAELQAIQSTTLGEAKKLIAQAQKEKAEAWAPRHFQSAKESVAEAERLLNDDRTQRNKVGDLARQAEADARRGLAIAAEAQAAAGDRSSYEAKQMDAEAQVHLIASAIDYEPDFEAGLGQPSQQIVTAIKGLQAERDTLKRDLKRARSALLA